MRKAVLCVMAAALAVSVASAEVVSFTAVESQGAAGMMSYTATLTGGYTLGTIDWDGFASTLNDATYGSELRLDISGPLGSATITLGSGTTYAPGAAFTGTSYDFNGAGDPAGDWTFDFYESYDDGSDGLPDAVWDYIDFTFNEFVPPEPPAATYLGVAGVVGEEIDMNTFGSELDTELGLYDSAGTLLATNDDSGGLQSQILYTFDAEGTYYLAMGEYNSTFADGWVVTTDNGEVGDPFVISVTGTDGLTGTWGGEVVWVSFDIVPEPASLLLLAFGGLLLRRR